jgi:hypothetical protein
MISPSVGIVLTLAMSLTDMGSVKNGTKLRAVLVADAGEGGGTESSGPMARSIPAPSNALGTRECNSCTAEAPPHLPAQRPVSCASLRWHGPSALDDSLEAVHLGRWPRLVWHGPLALNCLTTP